MIFSKTLQRKIDKMKALEAEKTAIHSVHRRDIPEFSPCGSRQVHRASRYKNIAHRGAYCKGWAMGFEGFEFKSPYKAENLDAPSGISIQKAFQNAWIRGYMDGWDTRLLKRIKEGELILDAVYLLRFHMPLGSKHEGKHDWLMTDGTIQRMTTYEGRNHLKLFTPLDGTKTKYNNIVRLPSEHLQVEGIPDGCVKYDIG